MKRLLLLLSLFVSGKVTSQVSYTGGNYVQNFDALAGTTNNTTGVAWTNNSTLPGWYSSHTAYGVTNGTMGGTAANFDGTSVAANVGLFSFGAAGSTDRALGSRATSAVAGMTNIYYGVRLVNNTSQTITAFNVIFTGEQWHKNGAATVHTLPLQYQIGATAITGGTWTTAATFSSPINTSTIAALNGNLAANHRGVAARVAGISWATGAELWLRIADGNESGNEQALGIDDFLFNTESNSALFFNGATNHVTMGAATSTLGASAFTLEAWVFRTGIGTTASTGTGGINADPVVTKGRGESDSSGLNCNYFMGVDASNRLVADFEAAAASGVTTGQNYPVTGSSTIPFMEWTHLAATYNGAETDGEKWKLYINGVKDTTGATPGVNTIPNAVPEAISAQHFAVGTAMNSTGVREGTFLGIIDEVRVWNVARSAVDIQDGMSEEISAATGLLGRYGLNEGTGTTAGNSVAGSPNGTLVNSPVWLHGRSFVLNTPPTVTVTAPADGFSVMAPATVSITAEADDSDGSIVKVEFFNDGNKIGEDDSEPFQFDWIRSIADAGTFSLTAAATDNGGETTTSDPVSVTITPSTNQLPTVAITSPVHEATFDALAAITFTADASDSDGSVVNVEFYSGSTKIGEDATAPYSFTWNNVRTGVYFISATAIDNYGATKTSGVIHVFVTNEDNFSPSVSLTSPADGADFTAGSTVPLSVNATDTDGVIAKVQFYEGTTLLGEDTSEPFSLDWATPAITGNYVLTAVATDNDGASSTSAAATITLSPAPPFSYTQNFNAMGTGTAAPVGWSIKNGAGGSGNSTWTTTVIASDVAAMVNAAGSLTASSAPTANNNNGYNAAKPGDPADRMIATAPSGNAGTAIQLQIVNTTGAPVSALRMGYDIQRFTVASAAEELPGYWVFYSLNNGATWTNIAALTPALSGGAVNVPNTAGVTAVSATSFSLSSTWLNGATLLLRWVDDNAVTPSPDQIIGLDNVTLSSAVGAFPIATLTAPADGATFQAPATVGFAANASDTDGTITKVEFYNGVTKVGEDTTAPYAFDWTNVAAGTYSLTAIATDSDGNPAASAARSITVNPAPGSGTMTRSPYLNSPNHNSIVVRWRTSQSVAGRVRYGTSPSNLDLFLDESVSRTNHEVKLIGLAPYTRYYYSVGSPFDTLTPEAAETTSFTPGAPVPVAADYTFRTSPTPGTAVNTRIWVIGDCGRGSQTQANGRDAYYSYNGGASFTGSRIPDLNLQLGDNAYNSGTETEYQSGYFNMYANIFRKMPQWSTLGNHDANNGDTNPATVHPYFNMFTFPTAGECGGVASGTEHYYSFDYGNIHFVCLDSQASSTVVDNPATPLVNEDGPMATWLRLDLESTTQTWIIAFWHHPPYSKGSHDSDTETQMVNMRSRFNPILEAGGVDLVFLGHSHNYERSVLLDGHYGASSTITPDMKFDAGNGSTTGFTMGSSGVIRRAPLFTPVATVNGTVVPPDGAYLKPLTGPRDHFGTVYNTAGMSGLADAGAINHSAMYISYNTVGTVNVDVNGNTLTATFVQTGGATPDNFTITKAGAADSDSDGIPDEWEIARGMDRFSAADATLDLDGDGLTTLQEFQAGTLPDSGAGTPQVTGVAPLPDGSVSLQLSTVAGKFFKVEANNSFPSGPWVTVAASVAGTGGIVAVPDPGSTGVPNRVYRVTVLP